jgi:enolase-phosphatase E1
LKANIKYILMDIEGTTSAISFVHDILFPFSLKKMESYVLAFLNNESVQECLNETRQTMNEEGIKETSTDLLIQTLCNWIKEDRKHPALKTLQGKIWRGGFESGELKGHVYPDVVTYFNKWSEAGLALGIYSSGSVEAQKLVFTYSEEGDLSQYLSDHFDTKIGHKRFPQSYRDIAIKLNLQPSEIIFLSDICEELDAALEAGLETVQLVRPDDKSSTGVHRCVSDFSEV